MAKITEPATEIGFVRNVGKVVMFNPKRDIKIARVYVPGKSPDPSYKQFIGIVKKWILTEWQRMTQEEKQQWEERAKKYYTTGFDFFNSEMYLQYTNSTYQKAGYGNARYTKEYYQYYPAIYGTTTYRSSKYKYG